MIEAILKNQKPDSEMKKGTVVCCKGVGKAIPKDGRIVLRKEARKSIPSTVWNGPAMKDDRRGFPKDKKKSMHPLREE